MSGDNKQLPRGMIKPTMAARLTHFWYHLRGEGAMLAARQLAAKEVEKKSNPYWWAGKTTYFKPCTGAKQSARIARQIAKGQLKKENGLECTNNFDARVNALTFLNGGELFSK